MIKPLSIVHRNAEGHVQSLQKIVRARTGLGSNVRLDANWDQDIVAIGLAGPSCEAVRRNQGGVTQVAPLMRITQGMWAWLGVHEEWRFDRRVAGARTFAFRFLSVTVHFGWKSDLVKPQIFRAEWAGFAVWNSGAPSFQGKNAGHPHWQFDVLESLSNDDAENNAKDLLELLRSEESGSEATAIEFMPAGDQRVISDIIGALKLSKIHFASAAPWWRSPPNHVHAHTPERAEQMEAWLDRTIAYIREELERLQTRQ